MVQEHLPRQNVGSFASKHKLGSPDSDPQDFYPWIGACVSHVPNAKLTNVVPVGITSQTVAHKSYRSQPGLWDTLVLVGLSL